jgi:hypothetical protein
MVMLNDNMCSTTILASINVQQELLLLTKRRLKMWYIPAALGIVTFGDTIIIIIIIIIINPSLEKTKKIEYLLSLEDIGK